MSESETSPAGSPAETPAATESSQPAAASESPSAGAPIAAAGPGASFDELRRKLLEQFSGLGEQVDTLQAKLAADLAQATAQARTVIEKEIAQVKEQYPDALHRIHELRDVGEEGWGVLRGRLDRLAGDLEKALGGFVSALSDAVKRQGGSGEPPAASSAASDSATPSGADAAGSASGDSPAPAAPAASDGADKPSSAQ